MVSAIFQASVSQQQTKDLGNYSTRGS